MFTFIFKQRVCQKYGQNEYNHIKNYGPLPQILRTNVPLSNLDDFAVTFKCPVGSPMNPPDKVYYWDRYVNVSLSEQSQPLQRENKPLTQERIHVDYDDDD